MASRKMVMVVLIVVLMSWTTIVKGETTPTSQTCIQALIPCQMYLSSQNPPKICCDPLKMAVESQLSCLCAAFNNSALAASFNMTQAIELPSKCGIKNAGPSMCANAQGSSPSTPSATTTPPPTGSDVGKSVAVGQVSSLILLLTWFIFC
ncbi:hypothetical protein RND81_08G124900 [Saponaria officinalis]|uniref:Bifunctional inhibitor/plant lipid transfer protein/seed storage helical domain-containing protein n=1 Tax=Saponaria officinalis TaxID=3572 RepID=A0AAW1J7D9_SAPOF